MQSPLARLVASAVSLVVIVGGYFLITTFVKKEDTVSHNNFGPTTNASGQTVTSSSSTGTGSSDFLDPTTFASQVKQLKKKERANAQLLHVTAAEGAFVVQLRKASNDSAYGYQSNAVANLEPVKVEISGSAPLKANAFPIAQLNSGVAARVKKQLKKLAGSKAKLQSLFLQRNPANGKLMWSISYKTDTRTGLSYFAPASGKPLSKLPY